MAPIIPLLRVLLISLRLESVCAISGWCGLIFLCGLFRMPFCSLAFPMSFQSVVGALGSTSSLSFGTAGESFNSIVSPSCTTCSSVLLLFLETVDVPKESNANRHINPMQFRAYVIATDRLLFSWGDCDDLITAFASCRSDFILSDLLSSIDPMAKFQQRILLL